jgi:L-ascorbate metabolism protein UlaG (beta-lactamase superfamily)
MRLTHIRNATLLLEFGGHCILVDPMLSPPSVLAGFRLRGGERRKNPLTALPGNSVEVLAKATHVLVTHEHPDHLDKPGLEWIRSKGLRVWASSIDTPNLRRKGLDCSAVESKQDGLGIECVYGTHGHGLGGWLMGPVAGFHFTHTHEPSIYLTGDTVMTDEIRSAIKRLQPDVIVAPAGAANFGFGKDILFGLEELKELVELAGGQVVFNHLESIDHCPVTRKQLRYLMDSSGLGERVHIPSDGEALVFGRDAETKHVEPREFTKPKPTFQKWITSWFAGT